DAAARTERTEKRRREELRPNDAAKTAGAPGQGEATGVADGNFRRRAGEHGAVRVVTATRRKSAARISRGALFFIGVGCRRRRSGLLFVIPSGARDLLSLHTFAGLR